MLWFTADTHFGHKMILEHCNRPFDTIHEHDQELVRRWNDVVCAADTIYHLGDFAYRSKSGYVQEIIQSLNGNLVLVPGGHDFTRANRRAWVRETGVEVGARHPLLHIEEGGVTYALSHWPMKTWWRRRFGAKQLHGHCHSKTPVTALFANPNRLDVGVDAWDYKPVSLDQILACSSVPFSDS